MNYNDLWTEQCDTVGLDEDFIANKSVLSYEFITARNNFNLPIIC